MLEKENLGEEKLNDSQLGCVNCRMHEILIPLESLCHLFWEGRWLKSTKSPPVATEKGAHLMIPILAYTILKAVLCHSHCSWPTRALFTIADCIFSWPCMWLSREKWGKTVPWDFPALYAPSQITTAVRVQEKRQKEDISSAQMYPATRESVCNLINILMTSTTGQKGHWADMAVTDHTFLENQERFIFQPVLDFGLFLINLCGGFMILILNP